jgi:hypothetical protein
MAAIDKVFITTCWENMFPAVALRTLARIGIHHNPLILFNYRAFFPPKVGQFRFECGGVPRFDYQNFKFST